MASHRHHSRSLLVGGSQSLPSSSHDPFINLLLMKDGSGGTHVPKCELSLFRLSQHFKCPFTRGLCWSATDAKHFPERSLVHFVEAACSDLLGANGRNHTFCGRTLLPR